jgi:PAS domain S-box-containing protein
VNVVPPTGRRIDRLSLLLDAGAVLRDTPEIPEALNRLADMLVPGLADACIVQVLDETGRLCVQTHRSQASLAPSLIDLLADEAAALADDLFLHGRSRLVSSVVEPDAMAVIVAPLQIRGRDVGVLTCAAASTERRFDENDRRMVEEIARQVALLLDATRLGEAATASRSDADLMRRRLTFLAEASAALATSLDYRTTLQTVSGLAVPLVAECCMVRMIDDDGSVQQLATTHLDPELQRLIEQGGRLVLPDTTGSSPLAFAIRTGETVVLDAITDDVRQASAVDEDKLARFRRLAFTASLTVPIETRGRRIGALTFATATPGRSFNADEVALAQDLARRAAVAVDSARLYGDIVATRDDLKRQLDFTNAIVRDVAEGIAVVDQSGRLTYLNPVGEQLLGYAIADLVGESFHAVVHLRDPSGASLSPDPCGLQSAYACGRTMHCDDETFRRADGSTFPVALSASPLVRHGELAGVVVVFRDIGQEQQSRELLRESEERLRRALIAARMIVWDRDLATGHTVRSDLASALYGRSNERLVNDRLGINYLIHPDDLDELEAHTQEAIRSGQPNEVEYRVVWPDGTVRWIRGRGQATYDANGRALRMSGTAVDVTDRKLAEMSLERLLAQRQAEAEELRNLHERLKRSLEAVLGLHEVGQLLTSTSNLDAAGRRLVEIAVRAANLQTAAISLRDARGRLRVWQRADAKPSVNWSRRTAGAVAARRQALTSGVVQTYQVRSHERANSPRTVWCVPLGVKGSVHGVLEAVGQPRAADEATAEILGSIASQAASALENARLYREVADSERALHGLVQQLMSAQEEERQRLAREVHDDVVQTAAGAQQFLEAFAHSFPGRSKQEREQLTTAVALSRQIVAAIRGVLRGLRPTLLDDFGLARGLQAHADRLAAEGLIVDYQTSLDGQRLAPEVEIALFRLAQEALTNVRKHAGTDRAELRLDRIDNRIILEVRDHGRGFDPVQVSCDDGTRIRLGLLGMRERIAQIGGSMSIASSRQRGTQVYIEVPMCSGEVLGARRRPGRS